MVYKNCGKFSIKNLYYFFCPAAIYLTENQLFGDSSSYRMVKDMARYCLNDIFQPLLIKFYEYKCRSNVQVIYLWWFPHTIWTNVCVKTFLGGKINMRIGSLASHLGVLDDGFEDFYCLELKLNGN